MSQKFLLIILSIWVLPTIAKQQPNVVGFNHTIHSKVFSQDRQIQVFVPNELKSEETCETKSCLAKYPVLYLLDGQRWFLHGVGLNNLLAGYDYIPNMIVVGITTDDLPRLEFYSDYRTVGEFIEKDVVFFVEKNYPVSSQKILFGWQYAGAATLDLLASKPNLFDSHIVTSPFPVMGKRMERLSMAIDSWSADKKVTKAGLSFASNVNEGVVTKGTRALERLLKDKASKKLNWKSSELSAKRSPSVGHRLSPLDSIFLGLRHFYEDYPVLEFKSLAEYKTKGGMPYVDEYYAQRAKKYSLQEGIPYEGFFYLAKLSLDDDDPETLELFITRLKQAGLLSQANYYWSYSWANLFLKHGKLNDALPIYQYLASRFTDEAGAINGIGDVYFARKDFAKATESYQKAVELAKLKSDDQLAEFQADLEKVENLQEK